MGKIKNLLNDVDMFQEDIEADLYRRYKDELEYEEWLRSKEFVEYVNNEVIINTPKYSENDITSATRYASQQITINPSEVGKKVYDTLFSEKIQEYLSLHGS